MSPKTAAPVSQAWIEPIAEDPAALSALAVAQARLPAAQSLARLRRYRLIELTGKLPGPEEQRALLHRSTQFYNPHKERLHLRARATDPSPLVAGEQAVLVFEREGERQTAAERWWRHETGSVVEVREGLAWVLTFDPAEEALASTRELAMLRDRRHGLFCNPFAQEARVSGSAVPLPWLAAAADGTRRSAR